jgi:hypothetical protein
MFSLPEDVNIAGLRDAYIPINMYSEYDRERIEDYKRTAKLAKEHDVPLLLWSANPDYRVQIPLIRLLPGNIDFEIKDPFFGNRKIMILTLENPTVIGSFCHGCSSQECEELISYYSLILENAHPGKKVEINLTRPAFDIITTELSANMYEDIYSSDEDNYFDPNRIFPVMIDERSYEIYRTNSRISDHDQFELDKRKAERIMSVDIYDARIYNSKKPVILNTFLKTLKKAKSAGVWVSIRSMPDIGAQLTIIKTNIPLGTDPYNH